MDHDFPELTSHTYIDEYKKTTDVPLRKVLVDILNKRMTCTDLRNFFSSYGCVEECNIIYNKSYMLSAHITFAKEEDAMKVLKEGTFLRNNNMRIRPVAYDEQPDSLQQLSLINCRYLAFQNSNYDPNDLWNDDTDIPSLNMLNDDCLKYIFSFLPIIDKLRAGIVCKRWNGLIEESWSKMRTLDFSPSMWGMSKKDIGCIDSNTFRNVLLIGGEFLTEVNLKTDPNLRRETDLADCNIPTYVKNDILSLIGRYCPNLKKLDTGALWLSSREIEKLARAYLNLTTVILSSAMTSGETEFSLLIFFQRLVGLKHLQIRRFDFMGRYLLFLPAAIDTFILDECALKRLINLRDLRIMACSFIHNHTMSVINNDCTNLRILKLKYLYDISMTEFRNTQLINLEVLSIRHICQLTDDILLNIVQRCPNLTKINVKDCPVTIEAVVNIQIQYHIPIKFRYFDSNMRRRSMRRRSMLRQRN